MTKHPGEAAGTRPVTRYGDLMDTLNYYNLTFVCDLMTVTTSVESDTAEKAVIMAIGILEDNYGVDLRKRASEIFVDGNEWDGEL